MFQLIKVTPDTNGINYHEDVVSTSDVIQSLIDTSLTNYDAIPSMRESNLDLGNYIDGDFWNGYMIIKPLN